MSQYRRILDLLFWLEESVKYDVSRLTMTDRLEMFGKIDEFKRTVDRIYGEEFSNGLSADADWTERR